MARPRLEELISRPCCCSWDTSSSRLSCSPSSSSPTTVTSHVSRLCMISSDTTVSCTEWRIVLTSDSREAATVNPDILSRQFHNATQPTATESDNWMKIIKCGHHSLIIGNARRYLSDSVTVTNIHYIDIHSFIFTSVIRMVKDYCKLT